MATATPTPPPEMYHTPQEAGVWGDPHIRKAIVDAGISPDQT
jgi:hypothetical protein